MEDLVKVIVLMAGGTGFIGSNILRKFLEMDLEVHLIVRSATRNWRIEGLNGRLYKHSGDLKNRAGLNRIITDVDPDVVINCSGIVEGLNGDGYKNVIQQDFINTANFVNACLKSDVNIFINTGSAYECGYSKYPISLNNCRGPPTGVYGIVKRAEREYVEMIARKYCKQYITMRLFTPFGYFDSPMRLIPHIITSLIRGVDPVLKYPSSGRDYIFMEDVANAYYKVILDPSILEDRKIVNVGLGRLVKNSEVLLILLELFGEDKLVNYTNSDQSGDHLFSERDYISSRLFGNKVQDEYMVENLKKTKEWFEENFSNYQPYYSDK